MSEHENYGAEDGPDYANMINSNPELKNMHEEFNTKRLNLYDWLGEKSIELPSAFSLTERSVEQIISIAELFGESSVTLRHLADDDHVTKQYVATTIVNDDAERIRMFSDMVDTTDFDRLPKDWVSEVIETHFKAAETDDALFLSLSRQYFKFVQVDVTLLLNGTQTCRDRRMEHLTREMPMSSIDSYHIEPNPAYMGSLELGYGDVALRSLGIYNC